MKSPAFSFYVRDWLCSNTVSKLHSKAYSKTSSNLSSRGLNAYMFLLCQAWLQDPIATLPDDDGELADLARVTPEEWDALKPVILLAFKKNEAGRWYNERQMHEASKQQNRSNAGSKGGSKTQANHKANQAAALEDANANANGGSGGERGGIKPEGVYAEYPRKVGKPAALRSIQKAIDGFGGDKVLQATKRFAAKWKTVPVSEMAFCPHPATWFNQERFNDDPSTWGRGGAFNFTKPPVNLQNFNRNQNP